MTEKRVHFEDLEKEKIKGFLEWVESEQDVDGFRLKIDGEVWYVHAEHLPKCRAEGCETVVPQGGGCLEHAGRVEPTTGREGSE